MGAREFLNSKPWLGWVVAALVLATALFVYWRTSVNRDPYSIDRLSETVTIRCIETGDEWTMERGLMERELRRRTGQLDPTQGLQNPKTGKFTGFPFDKNSWEETIRRINEEKTRLEKNRTSQPPSGARQPNSQDG